MTRADRIGVLGGTFDPIHLGHLEAAQAARRALDLDVVLIVPLLTPPHRVPPPCASAFHRFAMAALAVAGRDGLGVSALELQTSAPSYTAATLARLHGLGFQPWQLFFITGSDAFAEIASWYDYPRLLDLTHFAVIARPGTALDRLPRQLPDLASRMHDAHEAQVNWTVPSILLVEASTPDVSSTEIRRRVAAGEPLDGLLPGAVADHVHRHQLYQPRSAGPVPGIGRAGLRPA
jgi:nicotinate-nucleotide adenylyltransferase